MNFIGKTVRTAYGNWVRIIDIWDNVIRTDRGIYHAEKIIWETAY